MQQQNKIHINEYTDPKLDNISREGVCRAFQKTVNRTEPLNQIELKLKYLNCYVWLMNRINILLTVLEPN